MNESIKCWECLQFGKLRLDTYPQVMVHDRGPGKRPALCTLPPRDDRIPRTSFTAGPKPSWIDYYPSPWKEAS